MEIEKRPGWDWRVTYRAWDKPGELLVFGAMTIEQALQDARDDLSACELAGVEPDYEILSIERLPIGEHT